jgi:hypothetical protein
MQIRRVSTIAAAAVTQLLFACGREHGGGASLPPPVAVEAPRPSASASPPPTATASSSDARAAGTAVPRPGSLRDLFPIDDRVAWSIGKTRIARTEDGGDTWTNAGPSVGAGRLLGDADSVDARTAWAWTLVEGDDIFTQKADSLFRTTDGGAHWSPVVFPPDAHDNPRSRFVDASIGWVVSCRQFESTARVFSTADGGQTWRRSVVTTPGAPTQRGQLEGGGEPGSQEGAWFSVVDAKRVYVGLTYGHGMGSMPGVLVTTADGGDHWTVIGDLPNYGRFRFADASTGWLLASTMTTSPSVAWATFDGGHNWRHEWFDGKPHDPKTLDASVGYALPVSVPNRPKDAYVLVGDWNAGRTRRFASTDRGVHWRADGEVAMAGRVFAHGLEVWIWEGGAKPNAAHSTDGGRTWTTSPPAAGRCVEWAGDIAAADLLMFTSATRGWLVVSGPIGEFQVCRSDDAGATWRPVGAGAID